MQQPLKSRAVVVLSGLHRVRELVDDNQAPTDREVVQGRRWASIETSLRSLLDLRYRIARLLIDEVHAGLLSQLQEQPRDGA